MHTFKIGQDGLKKLKRLMLIRAVPIMLIAATFGIVISSINSNDNTDDINVLPITIPLVAVIVGIGLYRGVKRQTSLIESYTLTITNNLVTREQLNTPTIFIYLNNIKEISKGKNGSFTIKGKETTDLIAVPAQIDNYSQLETVLQQIQPIVIEKKSLFFQKYQSLIGLLTIGLMVCVYTVNNKVIVALSGTAFATSMIWSLIKIRTSKNVDSKTKRMAWFALLPAASVIAIMFLKLYGLANM